MPFFTVAPATSRVDPDEMAAYIRSMDKRQIDWTNTRRWSESSTDGYWFHVWNSREEAESFGKALSNEVRDQSWKVREIPEDVESSFGPLFGIQVRMRRPGREAEFTLHPFSEVLIGRRFPSARMVSCVTIEWFNTNDAERNHPTVWNSIATVLTGLDRSQLELLDGFHIVDVLQHQTVYTTQDVLAA